MRLHNDIVKIEDKVFDINLTRGWGKVINTTDTYLEVEFSGGVRVSYAPDGKQRGKHRTSLYWHDPVVCVPPKSSNSWNVLRRVLKSVSKEL